MRTPMSKTELKNNTRKVNKMENEIATLSPTSLMKNATDIANICKEIVIATSVEIAGKKHVCVEGWQALAVTNNCILGASEAKREYDSDGNVIGYSAKGFIHNKLTGVTVQAGEGFVGFDEMDKKGNHTWKNRPEYAGRAMAQTRAMGRAGKSGYSFIVTLMKAGLSTTPAEEVPEGGFEKDVTPTKKEYQKPANNNQRTGEQESLRNDDIEGRGMPETEQEYLARMAREENQIDVTDLIGKAPTKEDSDLYWKDKAGHKEFFEKYPTLELFRLDTGKYVFQPRGTYAATKKAS